MKGGAKSLLRPFLHQALQLINACSASAENTILNKIQTSQSHFLSSIAVHLQK